MLDRVRAARDAGLDTISFGDHHAVGPDGQYLQGSIVLARALGVWPTDRQAGLLFLVPLWHPVVMAELIGTLAALTDVPLIVQTGIGHGDAQFAAMGASARTRGAETDRRIDLVRRLLAGEVVDDDDLAIAGAAIGPRPVQPVHWWIGSGAAPAALDRAARCGDALYLSPGWGRADVARLSDDYRARAAALGRPARVVLRRDVLLDDDHRTAVATMDDLAAAGYRGMPRDVLVAGDPGAVADALAAYRDAGADEIAARVVAVPQPDALRTVTLLGAVRERLAGG